MGPFMKDKDNTTAMMFRLVIALLPIVIYAFYKNGVVPFLKDYTDVFGMFYPLIYKNTPSYYYDGNLYSITNEMSWLNGFKVVEVSQNYGGLFGLLCACALTGLLFLKPKENKVAFTSLSVIGGIGLISIISIPNFYALVFLAITFAVACYYRFLRNNSLANKILHYAVLVVAGIAVIMFLFAIFWFIVFNRD